MKYRWIGRLSDGWIGHEASPYIEEDMDIPPGALLVRTERFPWAVHVTLTFEGERTIRVSLERGRLSETVSIDEILPSRRGTLRIKSSKVWVLRKHIADSPETRELGVHATYSPPQAPGANR